MHPADIQAALLKRGYTQARVAHELGVSTTAVSNVIWGKSTSARIERRIAQIIGATARDVFRGTATPRQRLLATAA
jgi:predicted transcriptional regulator